KRCTARGVGTTVSVAWFANESLRAITKDARSALRPGVGKFSGDFFPETRSGRRGMANQVLARLGKCAGAGLRTPIGCMPMVTPASTTSRGSAIYPRGRAIKAAIAGRPRWRPTGENRSGREGGELPRSVCLEDLDALF